MKFGYVASTRVHKRCEGEAAAPRVTYPRTTAPFGSTRRPAAINMSAGQIVFALTTLM